MFCSVDALLCVSVSACWTFMSLYVHRVLCTLNHFKHLSCIFFNFIVWFKVYLKCFLSGVFFSSEIQRSNMEPFLFRRTHEFKTLQKRPGVTVTIKICKFDVLLTFFTNLRCNNVIFSFRCLLLNVTAL